jgi:hypothetical protein
MMLQISKQGSGERSMKVDDNPGYENNKTCEILRFFVILEFTIYGNVNRILSKM